MQAPDPWGNSKGQSTAAPRWAEAHDLAGPRWAEVHDLAAPRWAEAHDLAAPRWAEAHDLAGPSQAPARRAGQWQESREEGSGAGYRELDF